MRYDLLPDSQRVSVDLHGLTVEEAEVHLIEFLNSVPRGVRMVEVAHGYSHGTALKRMVKYDFYHWRVVSKQVGLNPGASYFVLK